MNTPCGAVAALDERARATYERQRREYADLCALDLPDCVRIERYPEFLRDFDVLCSRDYFPCIAIDSAANSIFIGTKLAMLRKYGTGLLREIGEFIMTISKRPSAFCFENITRRDDGGYHHPHITVAGDMCIGERMELLAQITDGELLAVADRLWVALNTSNGGAYSNPDSWPLAPEQEQT